MVTIGIKCIDQVLSFTNTPLISTGDQNVDKIQFEFCDLWSGFIKVAIFYQEKGTPYYSLIGADGIADVPNPIMKLTGRIYISVAGTSMDNQVRTSNIVRYTIEEGVTEADLTDIYSTDMSEEEQETVYEKILELAINMQNLAEDMIKNVAYVRYQDANTFEYTESQLEAKINAYTLPKAKLEEDLDELFKTTDIHGEALETQGRELEDIDERVHTLESDYVALSNEVTELKNTVSELSGKVNG